MPHIDDGTLHALIDGALGADDPDRAHQVEQHIGRCEDCRARLDAARSLRGEADDLLAATAPDTSAPAAVPDFDEVRRRAARGAEQRPGGGADTASAAAGPGDEALPSGEPRRPPRRRASPGAGRWTRRLSWAASIVLALGTGYLLRDMAAPPAPEAALQQRPGQEAVDAGDVDGPGSAGDADGSRVAGDAAAREAGEPAAAPSIEAEVAEQRSGEAPPPAARPEPRASGAETARADVRRAGAERAPGDVASDVVVAGAPDQGVDPALAPGAVDTLGAGRPGDGGDAAVAAPVGVSSLQAAAVSGDGLAGPWHRATLQESAAALDGPVYVLPRAEVVEVLLTGSGQEVKVLTEQRLESGVPVRVVQRRAGDPAADPAGVAVETEVEPPTAEKAAGAPSAALRGLPEPNRVQVPRDGFILELQSSLPAELLSILAGAARPAGEGRR